jgi:hypothetical protein
MVVPANGKGLDIFQYFRDPSVTDTEKNKFVTMIWKKLEEVAGENGKVRVWTDGSEIPWLHVRVTYEPTR